MLYVGTYTADGRSKGIQLVRMSRRSGTLELVGLAAATANPSWVTRSADGRSVFAVNEVAEREGQPGGGITAFRRDRKSNLLRARSTESSGGATPCHATTDRSGKHLFVANYGGGSVSVLPILPDGTIGVATSHVQHAGKGADPVRQEAPHAHCIMPGPTNRFVLVSDLGLDRVFVYPFDERNGRLGDVPAAAAVLAPGSGPRHLAMHPDGHTVYVANELSSGITVLRHDPATGSLDERQTIAALNEPWSKQNAPAEIRVSSSGRFLYMSNRGHDSIGVFSIDGTSSDLRPLQLIATGGKWPRHFAIDASGDFLVVANQRSDSLTSFRIDQRTGQLSATGMSMSLPSPSCICFA